MSAPSLLSYNSQAFGYLCSMKDNNACEISIGDLRRVPETKGEGKERTRAPNIHDVRTDKVSSVTDKDPSVCNASRMAGNAGDMGPVGKRNPGPDVVKVIPNVRKESDPKPRGDSGVSDTAFSR
jgi:hypothetical protein